MGSYGILRFVDTDGYDSHQDMAGLTLNHRFSARDTFGLKYAYTGFGYNDIPLTFDTQQASLIYEHLWSRRWRSDFEVGPEWVASTETSSLPTHTYIAGNASITYSLSNVTSH